jgi:DNA replication protein DnaC
MLNEPTLDKMKTLRLDAMAEAWLGQQRDPEAGSLAFDERLGLLVDAEWLHRENKRLARNLKEAKLRFPGACIEDIDYPAKRALDRSMIRHLATCVWVKEHLNVVVTGATGTGKSYIACALAQQACRVGYRALYRRASRLYDELVLARADGTYARVLSRTAKIDVLVIDDWGLAPLKAHERQDLLEVLEDRHGNRSTIFASQLPVSHFHETIGEPTIADAICERLLHNAHRIALKGPSRRKIQADPEPADA